MTIPRNPRRYEKLDDLVKVRVTLRTAVAAVRELPWDSEADLVLLSRRDVVALLTRYLAQELSPSDLETWANTVESREEIGVEPADSELLRAFVFETANPALGEPISPRYARRWLDRLDAGASRRPGGGVAMTASDLAQHFEAMQRRPGMYFLPGVMFRMFAGYVHGMIAAGVDELKGFQSWVAQEYCGRPNNPLSWVDIIARGTVDDRCLSDLSAQEDQAAFDRAIALLIGYCQIRAGES